MPMALWWTRTLFLFILCHLFSAIKAASIGGFEYRDLNGNCQGNVLRACPTCTREECGQRCGTESFCQGFSYSADNKDKKCILKSKTCTIASLATGSNVEYSFYEKIQIVPKMLDVYYNQRSGDCPYSPILSQCKSCSFRDCQKRCTESTDCAGISFHLQQSVTCVLRRINCEDSQIQTNAGYIFYTKVLSALLRVDDSNVNTFANMIQLKEYSAIVLQIRSCNNTFISLWKENQVSPGSGSGDQSRYEVSIDEYPSVQPRNSRTAVYKYYSSTNSKPPPEQSVAALNVVNCDQYRTFWLTYDAGLIILGSGDIINSKSIIVQYQDSGSWYTVDRLSFRQCCRSGPAFFKLVKTIRTIEPCASTPCRNNGRCISQPAGNFVCDCPAGFKGNLCQTASNGCDQHFCQNNGQCKALSSTQYECVCTREWSGTFCTVKVDISSGCNNNQCQTQNGECYAIGPAEYRCRCYSGWEGDYCQTKQGGVCSNHFCRNGAECYESGDGTDYGCNCKVGWSGRFCDQKDVCANHRCVNAARCVLDSRFPKGYRCECTTEFDGEYCANPRGDVCSGNRCQNSVRCSADNRFSKGYLCECRSGFQGEYCLTPIAGSGCADNRCQRGRCIADGGDAKGYRCECENLWEGEYCASETQIADACANHQCKNNAQCYQLSADTYRCSCASGWQGQYCQTRVSPCTSKPCSNGECFAINTERYSCQCDSGWTGRYCTQRVNVCDNNNCVNGRCNPSSSSASGSNSYTCLCDAGFTGQYCATRSTVPVPRGKPCDNNQCKNGRCQDTSLSTYRCICDESHRGKYCDILDYCSNIDCGNGKCVSEVSGATRCVCNKGYTGNRCNQDICITSPCLNSGTCTRDETTKNGFRCSCTFGFTGDRCTLDPLDEYKLMSGMCWGHNLETCNECTTSRLCAAKCSITRGCISFSFGLSRKACSLKNSTCASPASALGYESYVRLGFGPSTPIPRTKSTTSPLDGYTRYSGRCLHYKSYKTLASTEYTILPGMCAKICSDDRNCASFEYEQETENCVLRINRCEVTDFTAQPKYDTYNKNSWRCAHLLNGVVRKGDGLDSDCDGEIDEEECDLFDDDNDGLVDEDCHFDTTEDSEFCSAPARLKSEGLDFVTMFSGSTHKVAKPSDSSKSFLYYTPTVESGKAVGRVYTPLYLDKQMFHETFELSYGQFKKQTVPSHYQVYESRIPSKNSFRINFDHAADLDQMTEPLAVFAYVNGITNVTDGYTVLPTISMGRRYVTLTAGPSTDLYENFIGIVSLNKKVNITVSPSRTTGFTFGKRYTSPVDPLVLSSVLKYFAIKIVARTDLTGLLIESSEPVAIFVGTNQQQSSYRKSIEQIPSVYQWGQTFHVIPPLLPSKNIRLKMVSSEPDTIVNVGIGDQRSVKLPYRGSYEEMSLKTGEATFVVASKPIMLMVIFSGASSVPFLSMVPPVSQQRSKYSFIVPTTEGVDYETFLLVSGRKHVIDKLMLDGAEDLDVVEEIPMKDTTWAGAYIRISPGAHTVELVHSLQQSSTFGAYVFGKTKEKSTVGRSTSESSSRIANDAFMYHIGMNLTWTNVECRETFRRCPLKSCDQVDNDCDGRIDEEVDDGKDNDDDGNIDEDVCLRNYKQRPDPDERKRRLEQLYPIPAAAPVAAVGGGGDNSSGTERTRLNSLLLIFILLLSICYWKN